MKKSIYLAGRMNDLTREEAISWRNFVVEKLNNYNIYSPEWNNQDDKETWLKNYYMLDHSDILLVNMNYDDNYPYLGISMEIARAFYQRKPIIIFSSKDWVHNSKTLQYHSSKILNFIGDAIEYINLNYH